MNNQESPLTSHAPEGWGFTGHFDDAIADIFAFHTYRHQYNSECEEGNSLDTYRISEIWDAEIKEQMIGCTYGKKPKNSGFCLGKKINDKQWGILKYYGAKVTRTHSEKLQIINQLIDSGLFANNAEVSKYLQNIFIGNQNV